MDTLTTTKKLDELYNEIENASSMPLTNKAIIDREAILNLIDDVKNSLPKDFLVAKNISQQESSINQNAHEQAQKLISDAEAKQKALVSESAITQKATAEAEQIMKNARIEANKYKEKAVDYVCKMFSKAQSEMGILNNVINKNLDELSGMKQNNEKLHKTE